MNLEQIASPAPSQYTAEDYNILVGKLGDLSKTIKADQMELMYIAGKYTGANQVSLITKPETKQLVPNTHESLIEYMDKLIGKYKELLKSDDTNRNRGGSKKYHRKTRRKRSSITDLKLRLSRTKRREGS